MERVNNTSQIAQPGMLDCISLRHRYFKLIGYQPHDGQIKLHNDSAQFRVAVCGRRWGKTTAAAREVELMLLQPNKRVWIVAPYFELTEKVFREVTATLLDRLELPTEVLAEREHRIKFPWGSELRGKTADNPRGLLGEGLDLLVFDEAAHAPQSVWERYLSPTLLDRAGRALFITTPDGHNWLYHLFLRGLNPDYPHWSAHHSVSSVNPHLDHCLLQNEESVLPPEVFAQEYNAEFVTRFGAVFPEFSLNNHTANLKVYPGLPVYRGLDFGFTNPFACIDIQILDSGAVNVLNCYYKSKTTLNQHIDYLLNSERELYPTQFKRGHIYYAGDPSGAVERGELAASGIAVLTRQTPLLGSLDKMRSLMRSINPSGIRPLLLVDTKCSELIRELQHYQYPDTGGEVPIKVNDHCIDALRYCLACFYHTACQNYKKHLHAPNLKRYSLFSSINT